MFIMFYYYFMVFLSSFSCMCWGRQPPQVSSLGPLTSREASPQVCTVTDTNLKRQSTRSISLFFIFLGTLLCNTCVYPCGIGICHFFGNFLYISKHFSRINYLFSNVNTFWSQSTSTNLNVSSGLTVSYGESTVKCVCDV
jgi:hypothetical protein